MKYRTLAVTLGQWIGIGTLIGAVIGSATAFLLTANNFLGDDIREKQDWLIYLLPLGGLLLGYMYMKLGKKDGNDAALGNNLIIEGVHGKSKVLRRMGIMVYLGTFITILFGGSTGREGAAIQMGGSVAETFHRLFKWPIQEKALLLLAGISAGFGAAFGTPITGTVFAMEMTALGKLKYSALIPCLTASFVGHYVTKAWQVGHEKFVIDKVPDLTLMTFSKIMLASILFGLTSLLYCQLRHGIQRITEKLTNKNHMIRAFFGGAAITLLTVIAGTRDYNGRGLDMLEKSFHHTVPPFAFAMKLLFTAITMGTGFVGGEAIPLFFMGATLGNTISGWLGIPLSFLAALGMIAVFCGGSNTPIAAFLLSIELFDGKGAELFFIACVLSYIVSGSHGLWPAQTLYEPKSKLFGITEGNTIQEAEAQKRKG